MTRTIRTIFFVVVFTVTNFAGSGFAGQHEGYTAFSKQGEFTEVLQDLQDAIVNRGYVIDFVGHVDMMLERTSKTVGSVTESGQTSPYLSAKYLQFCSAKLTHQAVSANPFNLAVCPYVMFIFEPRSESGTVTVGYRRLAAGPSRSSQDAIAKIEALLAEISKEAVSQ